jgi:hypothetical protein
MMRRGIAPGTLVVAVVLIGWHLTGVQAFDIIRFLAYDIGFVAVPGVALLWAVRGHRSTFLLSVALGWPLGQTLEILAFSGTAALGNRALFPLYPIVVLVPCAYLIWRNRRAVGNDSDPGHLSAVAMWTAAGAVSLGLIYLTLMFVPLAPLPGADVGLEYPDYPYFIGLIAQVMNHWPPTTPGLVDVPLHYEWFVLFHIAAASQVTHVSIPIIGLRLDYVPSIVVIACQLLAVGRFIGRSAWTGVIAIVIIFLLGPLNLTESPAPFRDDLLVHFFESWTLPFGLTFFLALLYLISERMRADTWRTNRGLGSWALIALLMIGGSGAKATILPVIIVGVGLYAVVHVLVRRDLSIIAVAIVVLAIAVFVPTYILVYGSTTPDTTFNPLAWLAGSPPVALANLIHHADLRAIVLPFAYAAGLIGVLMPLAGMLYLLRRRHRAAISTFALPLCVFAAGLLIASLVHHTASSEIYFLDTGYVAGCLAAAEALRLAWLDLGRSQLFSRRAAVVALAGWIALLILVVRVTSHSISTPSAVVLRYTGIAVAGVAFVIAWALAVRARHHSSSGAIALGLIPILAASVLTSPVIVYPTVRKVLAGAPITTGQIVLVPGVVAALYWLRDHTSVDAVFAVNNHWIDAARTNGKHYYYAAFSERQAFIEAYNPYPIPPGPGTPAGANFIYRQQLNDAVFDHADAQALRMMTQQYAVRFLLLDRTIGSVNPGVLLLGHVVFSNQDAAIIAVG